MGRPEPILPQARLMGAGILGVWGRTWHQPVGTSCSWRVILALRGHGVPLGNLLWMAKPGRGALWVAKPGRGGGGAPGRGDTCPVLRFRPHPSSAGPASKYSHAPPSVLWHLPHPWEDATGLQVGAPDAAWRPGADPPTDSARATR